MVAHLKLCAALVLSAGTTASLAQALNDPTRPPQEFLGGPVAASAPGPAGSRAQVVIISKNRHQATINGQTVRLGGSYGNATVTRITDEEIVLRRPQGTETIKLYSSIQRTKRTTAAEEESLIPGRREGGTHEAN